MSLVNVYVTQDDIDIGEQQDCCLCPVAYAVMRRLQVDPFCVRVSYRRIYVFPESIDTGPEPEPKATYYLPTVAALFVSDFDFGGRNNVKPIRFNLERAT